MFRFNSPLASIAAALLLGPWFVIPALLLAVTFTDVVGMGGLSLDRRSFLAFSGVGFVGLMYAYPITVLFGLPMFLILRKLKLDKLLIILAVSQIPALILYFLGRSSLQGALAVSFFSASVAFGCWLVYYFTRPIKEKP